jgi:hypothetical protein
MSVDAELAQTSGFRVDSHDGRVGSVAAVLPRAKGEPGWLLVHTGLLSCRLRTVPFSSIESVNADERRVVLGALPTTIHDPAPDGAHERIVARA